jgi:hypothetical protein
MNDFPRSITGGATRKGNGMTKTKPDYQIAKEKLHAMWPELSLESKTYPLGLRTDSEKWKHYAYNVEFKQTKWGGVSADIDWRQGTGIKTKPVPVEVLASACRDYADAAAESFDSWAASFGYDTDSRKAERIYATCLELGVKLKRILTPQQIAALAELSAQL